MTYGNGASLQDAADDLVVRVLSLAMAMRSSGLARPGDFGPVDARSLDYLWAVGEAAAQGGDIRDQVFGTANS